MIENIVVDLPESQELVVLLVLVLRYTRQRSLRALGHVQTKHLTNKFKYLYKFNTVLQETVHRLDSATAAVVLP